MLVRAAVIVVVVALATVCRGQERIFGLAYQHCVPVTWRAVEVYSARLAFDAEQVAAAKALHGGYRAEFLELTERANKDVQAAFTKVETVLQERLRITEEYIDAVQALEKGLLRDLRALCTPEQEARFGEVERAQRRARGGYGSMAAGAGVDLVSVVEDLKIGRAGEIDRVLTEWEQRVDVVDQERERVFRANMRNNLASNDPAKMRAYMREVFEVAVLRRDATRRALRELEPLVGEEWGAALKERVQRESFPRVYAQSPVVLLAGFLERRAGLSEEQRRGVSAARREYELEAAPVNARLAAAVEAKQATIAENGSKPDDPADEFSVIRKERQALDDRYRERLLALLNDEQRAVVAARPEATDFGPEYLPDRGISDEEWGEFREGK